MKINNQHPFKNALNQGLCWAVLCLPMVDFTMNGWGGARTLTFISLAILARVIYSRYEDPTLEFTLEGLEVHRYWQGKESLPYSELSLAVGKRGEELGVDVLYAEPKVRRIRLGIIEIANQKPCYHRIVCNDWDQVNEILSIFLMLEAKLEFRVTGIDHLNIDTERLKQASEKLKARLANPQQSNSHKDA